MSQVKISKTLAHLINSTRTFHDFETLKDNLEASEYDKISCEITRVYHSDGIICGQDTSTTEDVFFFLKYKGFEIKAPKYRIILPDVHSTGGCYWEYVYIDDDGDIDTADRFEDIKTLTEEQLKEMPAWAQALAVEVTE